VPSVPRTSAFNLRRRAAAAAVLALTLSGCGDTRTGHPQAATPRHFTLAWFRPANFLSPITAANRWLPLRPGLQWLRVGTTLIGHRPVPHRVLSTVTDVVKTIDGVRAVAVLDQDIDAGQITQESIDWEAQDRYGNVWSVGSYTEEYEGGRFSLRRDAWLAGMQGGRAGILMPANPTPPDPAWTIARPPGADPDAAQAVATGQHQCVPFNCYSNVLVIREGKASALDNEFKFYAPGAGQIRNAPKRFSHHKDVEALANLILLTPAGLAEMSAEALRLDRHARITAPDVYGRSAPARRAR
jgi:hypothetical protein